MGHLITELEDEQPDLCYFDPAKTDDYPTDSPVTIDDLARLYPQASNKAKDDDARMARSREATAELCALLAFSATRNDDKVGLTLFHGDIEHYIPARKGKKHALRVVRELLAHGSELDGPATAPDKTRQWRLP